MINPPAKSTFSSLVGARHGLAGLFRAYPGLREIGIFVAALLVYQGSRAFVIGDTSTAFQNAAGVVEWEKSYGLFFELSIQRWALANIELVEVLNYFYLSAHWIVTTAFFVWLWHRRKGVYPYVRNAFLLANGIALTIFMVYPVAPPRLMRSSGFVDTLNRVSDVDLHGGLLSGWFNPYAAVPSMHFGYSIMIALVAMWLIRAWPLRFLALAYPAVVFITIVGTGNHFVIDAVAGTAVVAAGFVLIAMWMRLRGQPIRAASGA
ncbi:MAG: phosphatase PAP2 family protein [Thermoleophilia bacterium]|nr:phosphatase PAP2 family protein [Thermoleophilia bacterium]